jgi:hypothetical protein
MFSFLQGESMECAYPVIKETIPQSSLGYSSNNKYPGYPPLMNDGRSIIAGSRSETLLHNSIVKDIGTVNNAQYRHYMIKNAREIMETDFRNASNDVGYYERFVDQIIQPNERNTVVGSPYMFKTVLDETKPVGYAESDLKSIYLSREQLEAKRVSPYMKM